MGYFNTGLPCEHSLLVAVKEHAKILLHQRWFKEYETILLDMEENSRTERVDKLY